MRQEFQAVKSLHGEIRTPGDKSISHRTLMISALAPGESSISGISTGLDVQATAEILRNLGAEISDLGGLVSVQGAADGLHSFDGELYCGNSGTTMRLMAGILAGVPGTHVLTGDESLSLRPMRRVIEPLSAMGADLTTGDDRGTPPLIINGVRDVRSIDYRLPVPSAQVKSAILFNALRASGPSTVREIVRTRTNTEDMLLESGIRVTMGANSDESFVTVNPGRPTPRRWVVPGDPSQAAFFVVAGLLHRNADLVVPHVYGASERTGFLSVLGRMGGNIRLEHLIDVIDISAASSSLIGTIIDSSEIPSVDEVPILSVAAAGATGVTHFTNMSELRVKESDRFQKSIELVEALGAEVHVDGDNFSVVGLGEASAFESFEFDAGLDHRMAMSAAIAAICGSGGVVSGVDSIGTSFPNFLPIIARFSA